MHLVSSDPLASTQREIALERLVNVLLESVTLELSEEVRQLLLKEESAARC